jgi:hypothetical protein
VIAAIAVVFALALLVVGGVALVNAVTSSPDKPTPSAAPSPTDSTSSPPSASPTARVPAASIPLLIRVTGQATTVIVRVPDTGVVVTQGVHDTGEVLQYKQDTLDVVAANGGSLTVTIYGKVQPAKPANQRATWYVRPKS